MKIQDELTPYFCENYGVNRQKDYTVKWVDPLTLLVSERQQRKGQHRKIYRPFPSTD